MSIDRPTILSAPSMSLERGLQTGRLIHVRCLGEIVVPDYAPGCEPLAQLLGPGVYACVVLLDMERATFLDTTGVTWLVSCHRDFQNAGGRLILHSLPPRVRNVLRLLNLESVLHTANDVTAATALVERGKP